MTADLLIDFKVVLVKKCSMCAEWKSVDEFYAKRKAVDGRQNYCKTCQKAYRADKEERYQYFRRRHHLAKYGLTPERVEEMVREQGGRCAVCALPPVPPKGLHVDHDHETGQVRRMLCNQCNRILGLAQDDPRVLDNAAAYLREHGR